MSAALPISDRTMVAPSPSPLAPKVAAIAWSSDAGEHWSLGLSTLRSLHGVRHVQMGGLLSDADDRSLSTAIKAAVADGADQVLLAINSFEAAPGLIQRSSAWIGDDPRTGLVCFLSNDAGYLTLSVNDPAPNLAKIEAALATPRADLGPVPIAAAEGGVFLIGRSALVAADGFDPAYDDDPYLAAVEFGLRASRRGFHVMLDSQAYVRRGPAVSACLMADPKRRARLSKDYAFFPGLYDEQGWSERSPRGQALPVARAKVNGLRLAVDVSATPQEDGEAHGRLIDLLDALAADPRIGWLGVVTQPGDAGAPYSGRSPKIEIVEGDQAAISRQDIDVLYAPTVANTGAPWWNWRAAIRRLVVTYDAPRGSFSGTAAQADLLLASSADDVDALTREQAPFPPDRVGVAPELFPVEADRVRMPVAVSERGWAASPIAVCVAQGFDSSVIRRALHVIDALANQGKPLRLVAINNQEGCYDRAAPLSVGSEGRLLIAPHVTAPERAWLLRHADLILAADVGALKADLSTSRSVLVTLDEAESTLDLSALLQDPSRASATRARARAPRSTMAAPAHQIADRLYSIYLDALERPSRRL